MRDEETVQTALSAAETGHLVLSTLHTLDASEAVNRIIDFFPPHHQQQARSMIAGTLKGIVSQRLVPTVDGNGRVACCEILVRTGRVHDMIIDPAKTGNLHEVIAEGAFYGMQTFDQHLLEHLQAGRISFEAAMKVASSPHDFKLLVASAGAGGHAAASGYGESPGFTGPPPGAEAPLTGAGAPTANGSGAPPAASGPPPGFGH
jgi:twitching motility protein PilT